MNIFNVQTSRDRQSPLCESQTKEQPRKPDEQRSSTEIQGMVGTPAAEAKQSPSEDAQGVRVCRMCGERYAESRMDVHWCLDYERLTRSFSKS